MLLLVLFATNSIQDNLAPHSGLVLTIINLLLLEDVWAKKRVTAALLGTIMSLGMIVPKTLRIEKNRGHTLVLLFYRSKRGQIEVK